MDIEIIDSLIFLGVPGVSLGIFYLLLREFGFKFDTINSTWAAIIAIIFLLVTGGVTFYGLQQPPSQEPNLGNGKNKITTEGKQEEVFQKRTTEYRQAVAFQISWLVMSILTNNARHPEAVYEQIEVHSKELDINLPNSFRKQIRTDDRGDSVMRLISSLGGQIVAKHPDLTAYFEAGFNLPLDVGKTGGKQIMMHIQSLNIPSKFRNPLSDSLMWINGIHRHFENIIRDREN